MKQFYIIANPKYFEKTMGWKLKHNEMKLTKDKLVMFIASDNVPETSIITPYHCGWRDTDKEENFCYSPYFCNAVNKNKEETLL
jgi:hypothetical protein